MVLAMLVGGMLAAPLAAYVVRFVPARPLGLAVAGLLLLTQTRELADASSSSGRARWIAYGVIAVCSRRPAALRPRLGSQEAGLGSSRATLGSGTRCPDRRWSTDARRRCVTSSASTSPIIQAGMATFTSPSLAAAVSGAGCAWAASASGTAPCDQRPAATSPSCTT